MSTEIGVYPVTSDEAVRVLGSLGIDEVEYFLDCKKTFRKRVLLSRALAPSRPASDMKGKRKLAYVVQR